MLSDNIFTYRSVLYAKLTSEPTKFKLKTHSNVMDLQKTFLIKMLHNHIN